MKTLVLAAALSLISVPAFAGTATNYSEWGSNHTNSNRKEIGKFDRKSEVGFSYTRNGHAYESVLKNEFSADGNILSGQLSVTKKPWFGPSVSLGLVGTTANDFEAVGISTFTEDAYNYHLAIEGSSSVSEQGIFFDSTSSSTNTEWALHEVSAGTVGSDSGL